MTPYYRHSGKFSPDAPFVALAAGLPAALVLSWVYAYAILYIPIVGIVTFILTGGLGAGVGFATGFVLNARKVRSAAVAWGVGLFVGFVTLWLSWVSWTVGLLRRGDGDVSWLAVLFSPADLWAVVNKVNEVGAWSFKGATPTGGLLWVLWACEAAIIVGVVAWVSSLMVADPYCEACDTWCTARQGLATSAQGDVSSLREALERKDFAGALAAVGPASPAAGWLRYDVHECGSCGATNTLSVIPVTVKDKGPEDGAPLIKHLSLTRAEVAALGGAMPRVDEAPGEAVPAA